MRRETEGRIVRNGQERWGNMIHLPRMDFPKFDGTDPVMWKTNCELYFDMYQVLEVYKTRMAVMNFNEELHEWYMGLVDGQQPVPWDLLVEEVLSRFKLTQIKHPVDEFKRIHQIGKVEEYITRFDRARLRLMRHNPVLNEEFFIAGFVSGLKEELRCMVELFEIRRLNSAFSHALKVEASYEIENRRSKVPTKPTNFQNYPQNRRKEFPERKEGNMGNLNKKPWQPNPNFRNSEFQRRRALGLCDKCDEKYFPGHQCTRRLLNTLKGEQYDIASEEGGENEFEEASEEEIE